MAIMIVAEPDPGFLILPPRPNSTAELLAVAAEQRGMTVERFRTGSVPDRLRGVPGGHLYGGPRFAGAVTAALGIVPLEPADDWMDRLPREFVRRDIVLTSLPLTPTAQTNTGRWWRPTWRGSVRAMPPTRPGSSTWSAVPPGPVTAWNPGTCRSRCRTFAIIDPLRSSARPAVSRAGKAADSW